MKTEEPKTLKLPARLENLERLMEFAIAAARRAGLDEVCTSDLHLAADEACTNIINYAYPPGSPGEIELEPSCREGIFALLIRDRGRPFNPLLAPEPDLGAGIEERAVGGLGIFLMKKSCDGMEYRRRDGANELTLGKKLPGENPPAGR